MNKVIVQAVDNGVALGKAIQQRLKGNLKAAVRSLRVELAEQLDRSADLVLKTVTQKRHKIADNYLSLKAYAVAAADKVIDYTAKGKGQNLSSIGDLLRTIGAMGAVKAPKAQGLGMVDKVAGKPRVHEWSLSGSFQQSARFRQPCFSHVCVQVRAH